MTDFIFEHGCRITAGIDYFVSPFPDFFQGFSFQGHAFRQAVMAFLQRMPAPGLLITADQGGIIRVQEQQFKIKPVCRHLIHDFQQPGKRLAASGIYDHGRITARCLAAQFDKFRQQHHRKIIHTEIIQIFQSTKHLGLSSTGHACYNYETILLHRTS